MTITSMLSFGVVIVLNEIYETWEELLAKPVNHIFREIMI